MIDFLPVRCNEAAYADCVRLFADCFPGVDKFSREYIDWLYSCNPDGKVVGFDARDGDRLAAHYVCIPARAQVGDEEVRVLLSLNTATHPDYQGKGLFRRSWLILLMRRVQRRATTVSMEWQTPTVRLDSFVNWDFN